jgi:hypothetical protein
MVDPPVLFDTCILIDYLRGVLPARAVCDRYSDRAVSIITWMEVMAGASKVNEAETRTFLLNFRTTPVSAEIAELAVTIRKGRGIKLPDAIIQASAESDGRVLITRNTRDFPADAPGVHVPYTL